MLSAFVVVVSVVIDIVDPIAFVVVVSVFIDIADPIAVS